MTDALALAWKHHQAGEFTQAEEIYTATLARDDGRADVWHLLGAARHCMSRYAEAADCFQKALALKPDYGEPRNSLAVVLYELGKLDEAIAEFRRAIALRPGDADLRYNLGIALAKQGRKPEAEAAWKIALEINPKHPGAARGLRLTNGKRAATATSVLTTEQFAARGPTSHEVGYQPREVRRELQALLKHAWQAHLAGDLPAAEAGYRRGLALDARQHDVWYLLGAVRHSRGRAGEAAECFRRALALKRDYADAHNYLGVALVALGKTAEAVAEFHRAVELKPLDAELQVNLGLALRRERRPDEALHAFRRALRLRPEHAKAQSHLRRCLRALKRFDELVENYRQFAERDPKSPAALHGLGLALMEARRFDEAVETLRRALEVDAGSPRILNNLGLALAGGEKYAEAVAAYRDALRAKPDFAEVHNNLGVALGKQDKLDDAIAHYREAVRLLPDFAAAYANLGGLLGNRGQVEEAERHQRRAIELRPAFPEAHCNLGAVLMQVGRLDEAEAALRKALALKPDFVEAHANLGGALATRGNLAAADACYIKALEIDPKFPGARYNRSLVALTQGRMEEGWAGYEYRFQCGEFKGRRYAEPRWDGGPLDGRTLLVYAEQGLGDSIQFVRYLPMLENKGGRVLFLCPAALEGILQSLRFGKGDGYLLPERPGGCFAQKVPVPFSRTSVELVVDAKNLPKFDVQAPLMSLPYLLGTRLDSIPSEVPYLFADEERVAAWRAELAGGRDRKTEGGRDGAMEGQGEGVIEAQCRSRLDSENLSPKTQDLRTKTSTSNPKLLRVGIAWQGNPKHRGDRYRSVPLALFEPLTKVPGVKLFSLQKNHGQEQLAQVSFVEAITDLSPRLESFLDTAAVLANLDLLICCDTSLAHLAGALGRPAWVAIAYSPDWRWMLDRDDSPWYPSLRLFRQQRPGDWPEVFERLAAELERFKEGLRRQQEKEEESQIAKYKSQKVKVGVPT